MEEIKVSFTDFTACTIYMTVDTDGWLDIEDTEYTSHVVIPPTSIKDFFEAVDKLKEQLKDKEI